MSQSAEFNIRIKGLLWLAVGLSCIFLPDYAGKVLRILFSCMVISFGLTHAIRWIILRHAGFTPPGNMLFSVIDLFTGMLLLFSPLLQKDITALVLGFWIILRGALLCVRILRKRDLLAKKGWVVFDALLSIGLGVLIMVHPAAITLTLPVLFGFYAGLSGVITFITGNITSPYEQIIIQSEEDDDQCDTRWQFDPQDQTNQSKASKL